MSEKWAPGPWFACGEDGEPLTGWGMDEDEWPVTCSIRPADQPKAEGVYRQVLEFEVLNERAFNNAHLIAAAPEMYSLHAAELTDLDLLATAIKECDPVAELLLRIEDMKRRKQPILRKARGES